MWIPFRPVVLGAPSRPSSVSSAAHLAGGLAHHVERDAGRRVDVDPKLVRVLGVGRQVRPHVQPQAAQVHSPHDVGDVRGDERL